MTINVTVPYSEYKKRYAGFEKLKRNYNAVDKTIEIEISEKRYAKLSADSKENAGLALYEIIGLLQPGEAEKFVLAGSEKSTASYNAVKDTLSENRRRCIERAIELMKGYNI